MKNENKAILLIGGCGSGKTWVMKNIIKTLDLTLKAKIGLVVFQTNKKIAVLGNYDGSMFEGSDRLSMAVMSDAPKIKTLRDKHRMTIVAEGDRFTNKTFIVALTPLIVRIRDKGEQGRITRNSNQSERHIKSIQTRVDNIAADHEVENSTEALELIKTLI